jgi:transposase
MSTRLAADPITLSRLRWHAPTIAYMNRRLAQGKTRREIIRCLKRYIARQLFAIIRNPTETGDVEVLLAA